MSRRKIMTSIYLEQRQDSALKRLSGAVKVPMAALVREAVDDLLEKRKAEIPAEAPDPRQLDIVETR